MRAAPTQLLLGVSHAGGVLPATAALTPPAPEMHATHRTTAAMVATTPESAMVRIAHLLESSAVTSMIVKIARRRHFRVQSPVVGALTTTSASTPLA